MTRLDSVVEEFPDLGRLVIVDWIARGWVRVEGESPEDWHFAEVDLARIRLIRNLRVDLAVEEASLPLVLGLLDQVYGLHRTLSAVALALESQPDQVRAAVQAALSHR